MKKTQQSWPGLDEDQPDFGVVFHVTGVSGGRREVVIGW